MPFKLKFREQGETLTNRIENAIRDYNCNAVSEAGIATVKEFLANAEDAEASTFSVILDKRTYPTETLLKPGLAEWQGPALCFYNDSKFSPDDWKSFERIGESLKAAEGKIGQFGLGSLTGYFVTDVQQILSGHDLVIVDPHKMYTTDAQLSSQILNMLFLDITDMKDNEDDPVCDDQLLPFRCIEEYVQKGGAGEMLGLHGTMFRLPFRTAKTAKVSEISQECIGPGEVSDLLEKVAAMATELILFTKWVKEISVYVVNGDGGVSCQMFTKDDDEEEVELAAFIERKENNGVVTRFPELFPEGLVFYVMPMTFTKTCLPLHINARFKIQSDRRSLLSDVSDNGKGDHNKDLSKMKIGPLWAAMISFLLQSDSKSTSADTQEVETILNRLWPPHDCNNIHPRPLDLAAETMIQTVLKKDYGLLRTKAKGGLLVAPSDAVFLPEDASDIPAEAIQTCESIDLPIVNPPARVKKHLVEFSGANIRYLTPSVLRQAIQGKRVMKKTAAEILHFIMSDNMYDEMHNLRLVPIKNTQQLGVFKKKSLASTYYYVCDQRTRCVPQLIKNNSISFVDVDARLERIFLGEQLQQALNITVPGPDIVGKHLHFPLDETSLQMLWKLIQSWGNDNVSWEPWFSAHPIIPTERGDCLSLNQCKQLHVITPSMRGAMSHGLCSMLSKWGCHLVNTRMNEEGRMPWACAFRNKVHEQGNVAREILACIRTSNVQEAEESHPQSISELVRLLREIEAPQDDVARIPIFKNLNGKLISIHGKKVKFLPEAFDKSLCRKYIEEKSQVLVKNGQWERLYNLPESNEVAFFIGIILPGLSRAISRGRATDTILKEVIEVLNTVFGSFENLSTTDGQYAANVMKSTHVVLDLKTRSFHKPCEFSGGRLSKTLALGGSKMFRHIEQSSKGYSLQAVRFLERAGMHTSLSGQALAECVKDIENMTSCSKKTTWDHVPYTVTEILNAAIKSALRGSNQNGLLQLLRGPVFPVQMLVSTRTIGVVTGSKKYVRLTEAADWQHHNLVASSLPFLRCELGSLSRLRELMGIQQHPHIKHVLSHLINIAKPGGLFEQWTSKGEALKCLREDYTEIWNHIKTVCTDKDTAILIVDTLKDWPCVEVFPGKFAKVNELSLDEKMETLHAPYRVPSNLDAKEFMPLFRRMGASQFLWTFLEKIGCSNVREGGSSHLDQLMHQSVLSNTPGSVVHSILNGIESVAPTDEEKKVVFSVIRSDGGNCWKQLRAYLGSPGNSGRQIARLPLFETVENEYISPASNRVCILPDEYTSQTVQSLLKENNIRILKNESECEKKLNAAIRDIVPVETATTFFKKWLLECLKNTRSVVSQADRLSMLVDGIRHMKNHPPDTIDWIAQENIVMDPVSGMFFKASDYVWSGNLLFHFIFEDRRSGPHKSQQIGMLPEAFRDPAIHEVMKIAGLHIELNINLLYHCLKRIGNMKLEHRNDNLHHIICILNMCGDNVESLPDRCLGLLAGENVFPTDRAMGMPTEWACLPELCESRHKTLVAPLHGAVHPQLNQMDNLRARLGMEASPGVSRVVRNLFLLGRSNNSAQLKDKSIINTVQAAWRYLCERFRDTQGMHISHYIENLKDEPCVQLSCGRFVKPELSYDQMIDTGRTPYPVPGYLRDPEYVDFMRYLGVEGDPDAKLPSIALRGDTAKAIVMENLGVSFNTSEDSDVIFYVEDKHIHAHKVILRRSGLLFKRMFSGDWNHKTAEDGMDIIELDHFPGASYDALYIYLQYIYKGKILAVNGSNLQGSSHQKLFLDLLQLAEVCGDDYVKSFCEQRIVYEHYLDPQNCCEILLVAHSLRAEQLQEECVKILQRNKDSLQSEIRNLPPDIRNELGIEI